MRLTALKVRRQALPPTPSPLEQGDELYTLGQDAAALAAYERQAQAASVPAVAQEARYKAALCLERLNRVDEAATMFARVAGSEGERWPVAAAANLWLLYLERNRLSEAEAVFASLSARSQFAEFAVLLPEDARRRILVLHRHTIGGGNLLVAQPELANHLDHAVRVADLVWGERDLLATADLIGDVMRAYQIAGQPDKALKVGATFLSRCETRPEGQAACGRVLSEYVWLLRLRGEASPALAELDRWLARLEGDHFYRVVLLADRARLYAALNNWSAAEDQLAECERLLRAPEARPNYHNHSAVCLLRGFLSQRRGEAAAQAAWRAGTWKAWRRGLGKDAPAGSEMPAPTSAMGLHNAILLSLTNEMTDEEARQAMAQGLASMRGDSSASQLGGLIQVPPAVLRQMWRTPRGLECARKITFREVSHTECVRWPVFLLAFELIRQGAFAREFTKDEDPLLWKMIEDLFALYAQGKIGKTQMLQLGLTWKTGVTGFLSWDAVAPLLPPATRAPVAYTLGQRLLRLNKPTEAQALFRTAVDDAPPGSPLARLAQAERKPDKPR
jgi:tetratricopeptide (TPR) repeat protein